MSATRPRGFSLVELLVVLALLGLVAAFAAPRMGAGGRLEARDAAVRVATSLVEARERAMEEGRPLGVSFDARAGAWRVDGGGVERLPASLALSLGSGRAGARVLFLPDGSATDAAIGVVGAEAIAGVEGVGGRERVLVDGMTGRVFRQAERAR